MKGKALPEVKQKTFIFKYDPHFSPKQMFSEFKEAIHGKKYIQPENVMMANDLAVIHRIISKARLKVLANCGIIELKEQGKETQPIVLYEQIVLDFPVNKEVLARKKEAVNETKAVVIARNRERIYSPNQYSHEVKYPPYYSHKSSYQEENTPDGLFKLDLQFFADDLQTIEKKVAELYDFFDPSKETLIPVNDIPSFISSSLSTINQATHNIKISNQVLEGKNSTLQKENDEFQAIIFNLETELKNSQEELTKKATELLRAKETLKRKSEEEELNWQNYEEAKEELEAAMAEIEYEAGEKYVKKLLAEKKDLDKTVAEYKNQEKELESDIITQLQTQQNYLGLRIIELIKDNEQLEERLSALNEKLFLSSEASTRQRELDPRFKDSNLKGGFSNELGELDKYNLPYPADLTLDTGESSKSVGYFGIPQVESPYTNEFSFDYSNSNSPKTPRTPGEKDGSDEFFLPESPKDRKSSSSVKTEKRTKNELIEQLRTELAIARTQLVTNEESSASKTIGNIRNILVLNDSADIEAEVQYLVEQLSSTFKLISKLVQIEDILGEDNMKEENLKKLLANSQRITELESERECSESLAEDTVKKYKAVESAVEDLAKVFRSEEEKIKLLKKKIANLTSELEQVESENHELVEDLNFLLDLEKTDLEKQKKQVKKLEAELLASQSEQRNSQKNDWQLVEEKKEEIIKLQRVIAKKDEESAEKLWRLNQNNLFLAEENERLTKQSSQQLDDNKKQNNIDLLSQGNQVIDEKNDLIRENELLNYGVLNKNSELEAQTEKINDLAAEITTLSGQLDMANENIATLQVNLEAAENERDARPNITSNDYDNLIAELNEANIAITDLNNINTIRNSQQNTNLHPDLQQAQAENLLFQIFLAQKNQEFTNEQTKHTNTKSRLTNQRNIFQNRYQRVSGDLNNTQQENNQLKSDLNNAKNVNSQLKNQEKQKVADYETGLEKIFTEFKQELNNGINKLQTANDLINQAQQDLDIPDLVALKNKTSNRTLFILIQESDEYRQNKQKLTAAGYSDLVALLNAKLPPTPTKKRCQCKMKLKQQKQRILQKFITDLDLKLAGKKITTQEVITIIQELLGKPKTEIPVQVEPLTENKN
ncbi:13646_t:CDS:10 [Entrophospora sp. SA101]|nr:13646_t:CDS:10 [Entrophospora sp. SA101]